MGAAPGMSCIGGTQRSCDNGLLLSGVQAPHHTLCTEPSGAFWSETSIGMVLVIAGGLFISIKNCLRHTDISTATCTFLPCLMFGHAKLVDNAVLHGCLVAKKF